MKMGQDIDLKDKRILVIGGAGYIGSHTVRALTDVNANVQVLDNLSTGHKAALPREVRLHEADLGNRAALRRILEEFEPEGVIHFAALASVPESMKEPARYVEQNDVKTATLIEELTRRPKPVPLIFSSTAATYGNPEKGRQLDEQHPQKPINMYGLTKLFVEKMLDMYAQRGGVYPTALRYFNACGAHPSGEIGEDHTPEGHLIPNLIRAALGQNSGQAFTLYGKDFPTKDGTCVRDYVHVGDLASAHLAAIREQFKRQQEGLEPEFEAYNVATGNGVSNLEVLKAVEKVTGKTIPREDAPRREGDPAELVANSDKIQKRLGWKPYFTDIFRIVETAVKWHRSHPNGYRSK